MDEITLLKRELKCWESMFERKHGRKPNKDDVSNTSDEIKDTYRKYRQLKELSTTKKEPKDDNNEDDGVFGQNLNKKYNKELPLAPVRMKSDWANIKPVRLLHGQRPTRTSKVCPTAKSANENTENEDQKTLGRTDMDHTTTSIEEFGLLSVNISGSLKTSGPNTTPGFTALSCIKKNTRSNNSRIKRRASLFSASLKKIENAVSKEKEFVEAKETSTATCSPEDNKSNIQEKGSERVASNLDRSTIQQEAKHDASEGSKCESSIDLPPVHMDNQHTVSILSTDQLLRIEMKSSLKDSSTLAGASKGEQENKQSLSEKNTLDSTIVPTCIRPAASSFGESSEPLWTCQVESSLENMEPERKGSKRKVDQDPSVDEDSRLPVKKKAKAERFDKFSDEESINNGEDMAEPEYDKGVEDNSDEGPTESFSPTKVKSSSSMPRSSSSGLVSDNFRRLDMKHRSYRRRGGGITGGAHKRRAWVRVMKARGEYVGKSSWSRRGGGGGNHRGFGGRSHSTTGTCFKCGQEGHWAKNCKGMNTQKARELPDDDDNEEEFTPEDEAFFESLSLEVAANMAAGIPVTIEDDVHTHDSHPGMSIPSTPGSGQVVLPHQLPRAVYVPPPPPQAIEPLYPTIDGTIIEMPQEVFQALEQLGFSSFRSGQQQAVMCVLSGVSSLVVLSTGAGKSLCYQLPAYMYYKRFPSLTLVISPLVSLMEDQITGLPFGLKGACLHTNQTKAQRIKILEDISSGKVAVLLLSAEALVGSGTGIGCLPPSTRMPPIAFACIDEAHCLSEWSHNFRPSYLRVCKVLRERFGVQCFLGLTATATRATASSVAQHLGISDDTGAIIRGAAVPPNLCLSGSRDYDKDKALMELLQGRRFSQCESIIIYCTRREVTERVATLIRTCMQHMQPTAHINHEEDKNTKKKRRKKKTTAEPLGWEAESYHAGMTAAQRRRVQKRFMSGQLRVVAATVAFGMGLDKSNVRAIIHYNMPKSFESYVQEIGRAGRDGLPSHCHVFLDREGKDLCELRRHIHANAVDRITVKKLVKRVFPRCECGKLHREQEERRLQNLRRAEHYSGEASGMAQQFCMEGLDEDFPSDEMLCDVPDTKPTEYHNDANDTRGKDAGMHLNSSEDVCSDQNNLADTTGDLNKEDEKINACGRKSSIQETQNENEAKACPPKRVCGGHEVAIVTETAVQDLDMREENIATLLCYLELHANHWVEVLHPVKSICTIKFYGGHSHLMAVAKRIPPVAAALVQCKVKGERRKKLSSLTFSVVEIADKMGWDLQPVCSELRALQWNSSLAPNSNMNSTGQSGILVEFSDSSLHIRAPGDLTDEERDGVCDFLADRIQAEERTQLQQLNTLHASLKSVSCKDIWQCADEEDKNADQELKIIIQKYFEEENNETEKELQKLQTEREHPCADVSDVQKCGDHVNWDYVSRDIRTLLSIHHDHSFTGRAVARIFHGIDSPCYPAEVWGRDRRFWRKHLYIDFNSLRKFAIGELLKFR